MEPPGSGSIVLKVSTIFDGPIVLLSLTTYNKDESVSKLTGLLTGNYISIRMMFKKHVSDGSQYQGRSTDSQLVVAPWILSRL